MARPAPRSSRGGPERGCRADRAGVVGPLRSRPVLGASRSGGSRRGCSVRPLHEAAMRRLCGDAEDRVESCCSVRTSCEHVFVMSTAKHEERERALALRRKGWSLNAIAREVGVAKSSVSVWVRDVELTPEQHAALEPPKKRPPWRAPKKQRAPEPDAERWCKRCQQTLPLILFNRAGDGHQHWCRDCFRTYLQERGQLHRDQTREASRRRRRLVRDHTLERLAGGCVDCGEPEVVVLEFDHLGPKRGTPYELWPTAASLQHAKDELARTEVVCVCCPPAPDRATSALVPAGGRGRPGVAADGPGATPSGAVRLGPPDHGPVCRLRPP